jgi:hypothetical protein
MEERMAAHAGADGAPRLTRAEAAHALGADLARLEDALTPSAHDAREAQDARTGSGLREDQAAAALATLTDDRLVSVRAREGGTPLSSGNFRCQSCSTWASSWPGWSGSGTVRSGSTGPPGLGWPCRGARSCRQACRTRSTAMTAGNLRGRESPANR